MACRIAHLNWSYNKFARPYAKSFKNCTVALHYSHLKCQKSHPIRMTYGWLASLHLPNGKGRTCSPKIS